jgi:superfamily I DNA/RNA helicase
MIFSNSRFVNVIAGAGSGKTTTMILRIIYMIKYLNIDIDHITVITFTNASRKDFTTKLSRVLAAFNEPYNYEYLWKNTVKTFHSKMLSIIKYCGLECNNLAKQVFEHLDSKNDTVNKEDNNQDISIDEQLDGLVEDASDNFYDLLAVESRVGSKKYAYLMECYFDLYSNQNDDTFKKLANYLFDMRQVKTPSRKNNISEVTILRVLETDDLMLTQK